MNNDISRKILLIGFGSIGRRHFRNLKNLGYGNVFAYDKDKKKTESLKSNAVSDITPQTLKGFSIVFICNPTSEHFSSSILAAEAGCHLFIEKPISHTLKGISRLQALVKKRSLITMVAANIRFHPALQFIKRYIAEKRLGEIYKIHLEFGHFLPYWRSGMDYRKGYAMRKKTGGGILLDDIHEYDLLFWLLDFKKPVLTHIVKSKRTNLTTDTEDLASSLFLFPDNTLGTVSSDYLSQTYRRNLVILGEKGNLTWDFKEDIVWRETKRGARKIFVNRNYDVNEMYEKEIRYFLDCVSKKRKTDNDISRAAFLLKGLGIR